MNHSLRTAIAWALAIVLLHSSAFAQQGSQKFDFKFGKVSVEDFELPADAKYGNEPAYIIADIGKSSFRGNNKGWFTLHFERKVRIRINTADGLDAADFSIPVYHQGSTTEKLVGLKAVSYNLEGDKVVETVLKNDQVFTDKLSRYVDLRKFSVPGAKAGSLIEVKYTIESDFISGLQPWEFQGKYPRYWSQYEVTMPEFFNYITIAQGYNNFFISDKQLSRELFTVTVPSEFGSGYRHDQYRFESNVAYNTWVMKNVPALKEEAFTSTVDNHISKIEFQLSQYRFPNSTPEDVMATWPKVVSRLNDDSEFGADLYKNNNFLDDELKPIVAGATDEQDKARRIYKYVQQKYTCTASSGLYMTSNLKAVQKAKSGNVADINLLLIAMLQHEKIKAYPVILSTRSHGFTHEFYPLMSRYNYVVANVEMGGRSLYLDATQPGLAFGMLPAKCYNGHARVINGTASPVYFFADSITEKRISIGELSQNERGEWKGSLSYMPGTYESLRLKQLAREKGEAEAKKEIGKMVISDYTIENQEVKNLDQEENAVHIKFELKPQLESDADILYLNPFASRMTTDNPFQSAERRYPIEMAFTIDETHVMNIDIPDGYTLEERPKSARVNFNDEGYFEYLIGEQDGRLMIRTKLKFNKANFPAEEYPSLRDFYAYVIKKYKENIVLKKKAKP